MEPEQTKREPKKTNPLLKGYVLQTEGCCEHSGQGLYSLKYNQICTKCGMAELDSTTDGQGLQKEKKPSHKCELWKFNSFPAHVPVKKIMPFVSKLGGKIKVTHMTNAQV